MVANSAAGWGAARGGEGASPQAETEHLIVELRAGLGERRGEG
jgi:hypothetical protein